jgi:PEP-CTERM motif
VNLKSTAWAAALLASGMAQATVTYNTALPLARDNPGPDSMIVGSGIPANGFAVDTASNGASVALKARDRDTGQPLSQSNGVYQVSPGLSTSVSPGAPQLAIDFQFAPGSSGLTQTQVWLKLMVDFDPTAATNFATILAPMSAAGPNNSWDEGDGYFVNGTCKNGLATQACTWTGSDPYAYSQSWSLEYPFWGLVLGTATGYNAFAPGLYDISLTAYTVSTQTQGLLELASVRIQAQVIPEPGSLALVGLALAGAGLWRRRMGKPG